MDNFDLKKYLAEGRIHLTEDEQQGTMSNIEVYTATFDNDFGTFIDDFATVVGTDNGMHSGKFEMDQGRISTRPGNFNNWDESGYEEHWNSIPDGSYFKIEGNTPGMVDYPSLKDYTFVRKGNVIKGEMVGEVVNEVEDEKMSDEEIQKKLAKSLQQGLGAAKALENEPVSKKDKELNEMVGITVAALIIGAPGLIKVMSKISEGIGWLFGLGGGDGNIISRALGKASHWLHEKYIEGIAIGLKKAYPSRYDKDKDGKVDGDMEEKLKTDATKAYAAILIAAAIATGFSVAHAASNVVAALETAHIAVDIADVTIIAKGIAARA
jgi:hypothetical protein